MPALQAVTLGPPLDLPASEPVTRLSFPGSAPDSQTHIRQRPFLGAFVICRFETLSESGEGSPLCRAAELGVSVGRCGSPPNGVALPRGPQRPRLGGPPFTLNQATEAFLEAAANHPRGSSRLLRMAPSGAGPAPLPLRRSF